MLLKIGLSLLAVGIIVMTSFLIYQIHKQKKDFAKLILENPATTSVAAYTIDDKGDLVDDGNAIFQNADTPLVTASMMKLVVLTAYENAVAKGELDPNELVKIVDLERYYLPKTDGNAHINGLASLKIKTDDLGFALDQKAVIALDEIARIMIHYSGNAETDYLIQRLGYEKVNSIAGMQHHAPIHSILGISLAMMDHERPLAEGDLLQQLIRDVERENYQYFDQLVDLYLNDPNWRARQIEYMRSDGYITAANALGWEGQVRAGQLFPKGTAREYTQLMAKVSSGQMISQEVSSLMQKKLETIPADWPLRTFFFRRYGSKDGLTAGLINLATYGVPKNGGMAGKTRIVVIMTNDLPIQTWSSQVSYQGIYFFQTDLARARGVFSELVENIR